MRFCGWAAKRPKRYAVSVVALGGGAPKTARMKSRIFAASCLLVAALSTPAAAQTFKWKFTIPDATFPCDQSMANSSGVDAAGNIAFTLISRNTDTDHYVQRLFWLNKAGIVLHAVDLTNANGVDVSILQVSGTQLIISFQTDSVNVVRKYVRHGKTVTEADTTFSLADSVPMNFGLSLTNATGFFAVANDGAFSKSVTRYTYR